MRTMTRLPAALLLGALLACGGSDESDPKDMPGVDASGTSDTELFTQDPGNGPDSLQGYTPASTDTTGGDTTPPAVQTHAP